MKAHNLKAQGEIITHLPWGLDNFFHKRTSLLLCVCFFSSVYLIKFYNFYLIVKKILFKSFYSWTTLLPYIFLFLSLS